MEQGDRAVIRSYDDLIGVLAEDAEALQKKADQKYQWRYVFRRIPLFFGFGLIFFAVCFAIALQEGIGVTAMNAFLHGSSPWVWKNAGGDLYIPSIMIIMLVAVILALLLCSCACKDNKLATRADVKLCQQWNALAALGVASVAVFCGVLACPFPLYLGLAIFASVTLIAMWTDRTLGFTRASERYALFAKRAARLKALLEFRKSKSTVLQEKDLQEVVALFDELALSKYHDTVGDTFFVLKYLERLKLPSPDKKDGG